MKKLLLSLLLLAGFLSFGRELQLAQDGKTDYAIVIPDAPAAVLKNAAKELGEILQKATGAEFPVFEAGAAPKDKPALRICDKAHFADVQWKNDETAIVFDGSDILFDGQMPRGPLYAVYHFLENYVGVRWWTAEETDIPSNPNLAVKAENYRYAPPLWVREAHYYDIVHNYQFAAHMKCNGHFCKIPEELGGHYWIIGFCHTFGQFLPASKYFKDHPDWYGMVDGKRQIPYHYQMCLTNEEMKAALIEKVMELVRKNPEAGMISISQNDGGTPCQCPKCRAIDEAEGSPAGLMIRVANEVAAAINKEYPDFMVNTLAYTYTRKPPKITRPSKNVVVQLCSIEGNFAQSLEFGEDNKRFCEDLHEWSAISHRMYVWNYIANFTNYMQPHPNYRNIGNDIRFFVKNNVIGNFEQGDTHCITGDFPRLRAWLISHLLWDPEQDERQLMSDFLNGYYGKAGPYLLDYLDYICDAVEDARKRNGYKLGAFNNDVSGWMDVDVMNKALELYALAEKAVAGEPVYATRVRRERLSLDQVCLRILPMMIRKSRFEGTPMPIRMEDPAKMANEFAELTAKTAFIREHGVFGDYGKGLRDTLLLALDENAKLPDFCKEIPADSWDIFPVNSYILAGKGTWVDIVDDPEAMHGKAARLTGNHEQWAIQRPFSPSAYDRSKKWQLVFWAKVDANATTRWAMGYGVYDSNDGKTLLADRVPMGQFADAKGQYVRVVSKPFSLGDSPLFWFAPPKRALDEVQSVSVDAALLVRADVAKKLFQTPNPMDAKKAGYVPEICKGLPEGSWKCYYPEEFQLKVPDVTSLVEDRNSLHGMAARLSGKTKQWAIQIPVNASDFDPDRKWRMAFRVRAEGDATDGTAFVIGIDDRTTGKRLAGQGYSMAEVGKDYVVLTNRNAFKMGDNPYVWFAGPQRPENEVKNIYIDELVIFAADIPAKAQPANTPKDDYVPAICKGLPKGSWQCFRADELSIKVPAVAQLVNDPAAIHGKAVRLSGTTNQWAVQVNVNSSLFDKNRKWRLAFRVRTEGNATSGRAFVIGIDDRKTNKRMAAQEYSMTEAGSQYVVLTNRNAFKLSDSPYVWFSGAQRPETEVKYIFIDELVILPAD